MVNGDVDMIFGGYNNELVRANANPAFTVYYGPGSGGFFFYFNFARAPFDDRRMREAAVRAIDLNALAASQYSNQLVGSDSLFEAQSPYHDPAASDAWPKHDIGPLNHPVRTTVYVGTAAAPSAGPGPSAGMRVRKSGPRSGSQ
jgi:ABC-type oligopeptide transport system substrate-binding subunit